MSCLPLKQLSKSQRSVVELQIEPDAKIVQSYFRSQASLKTGHVMRTFASQAKGIQQLVVHGLDDLPQTGQPTTQSFGPALLAPWMRWGDQVHLIPVLPLLPRPISCKPFVSHIRAVSRQASTRQAWRRRATSCKQSSCQMLIMGAGASEAEPGNHSLGCYTEQEMEAFVPAEAITPADIGLTCQPAQPAPLRITSRGSGAVENLVGRVLPSHKLHQKQRESRDRVAMGSL